MKTPRDMRPNEFKEALRRQNIQPLPDPSSNGYRFTLTNGLITTIIPRIRTAPIRRTTLNMLVAYRTYLQGLLDAPP